MAIDRFPYQLLNGIFQPVIPLGILLENAWRRVGFYVDSGANYSVVSSKVAEEFEFNYLAGRRINLQVGDGGLIPVRLIVALTIKKPGFFKKPGFWRI